jgi:hypothetical protein
MVLIVQLDSLQQIVYQEKNHMTKSMIYNHVVRSIETTF